MLVYKIKYRTYIHNEHKLSIINGALPITNPIYIDLILF